MDGYNRTEWHLIGTQMMLLEQFDILFAMRLVGSELVAEVVSMPNPDVILIDDLNAWRGHAVQAFMEIAAERIASGSRDYKNSD